MERDLYSFLNSLPRAQDIIVTDVGATRSFRMTPEGKIFVRSVDRTREAHEFLLDPRMVYRALRILNGQYFN